MNSYESGSTNISGSAAEQETSSACIHNSGLDEWKSNPSDDDLYFGNDDEQKCAKRFKGGSQFDVDFFRSSNDDERPASIIPDRQCSVTSNDNKGKGFFDEAFTSGKLK